MKTPFPHVPKVLLDKLEELFPDQLPNAPASEAEVAFLSGRQAVIRKLRSEYDRQTQGITT